jgi:predicted ArsR family transcriptional regulator
MSISTSEKAPCAPDVPVARTRYVRLVESRIIAGLGSSAMTAGEIGWKLLGGSATAAGRDVALGELVERGLVEREEIKNQGAGPRTLTVYRLVNKPGRG